MNTAAVLFVLAALGGVIMLGIRLRGTDRPPTWLAIGHGLIAFCGVAVLAFTATQTTLPAAANWALILFLLAAVGGATIFFGFHLRGRPLPILFILGHGLLAATALTLLLCGIFL